MAPSRGTLEDLTFSFAAWRVFRRGHREVVDAIVAPEHRGPSPALAAGLRRWPGAHYWADARRSQLVLVRSLAPPRRERWALHLALLALTVVCTLAAGAVLAELWSPPPGLGLVESSSAFAAGLVRGDWRLLLAGWSFAVPLLAILLVHELGHYFAARRYGIDSSPPYFLPVPPTVSPIGSLGAFIRLRSPVLDRRQLLDVGAAGPLAGFVVALGVLAWGYSTSEAVPWSLGDGSGFVVLAGRPVFLGDSVLTAALREHFFPSAAAVHLSLPAFAGWTGAFITGLNLLPLSQLDGGHVLYGLLGRRQAAVGLVTLVGLLYLSRLFFGWIVWVVVVLLVGGGRWSHPSVVIPEREVPASRRLLGLVCVLVFVLTFIPVPIRP